jgi:hypothetical protein
MKMKMKIKWFWGLVVVFAFLWVMGGCEQASSSSGLGQEAPEESEEEEAEEAEPGNPLPAPQVKMTGILISSSPELLYYALGQRFDPNGLIVEGLYDDNTSRALTASAYTLSPVDTTVSGPQRVRVSVGAFSDSFPILVNNSYSVLDSISVNFPGGGVVRYIGQTLGTEGITVTGHYNDGNRILDMFSVRDYDRTKRGDQTVTLSVNGKTATLPVTVKVPANAAVRVEILGTDEINYRYGHNNVFIRGQALDLAKPRFNAIVSANNVTTTLKSGEDIKTANITGLNLNIPGKKNITLTLDEKAVQVWVYVADIEPELYFDYGFMRHQGDLNGLGGAVSGRTEGSYYTPPGKPLVLSPVRVLIGYDRDNNDLGVSYSWTATPLSGSPGANHSASSSGEFLTISPQAAGTWEVSVTVTGRNFIDGNQISKTATTKVICGAAGPPVATPYTMVRNFSPGQFTEDGTGHGWSLGCFGGYLIKSVTHKTQYTIMGNSFGSWVEPGVVWFQEDNNNNGLPDEMWYELNTGNDPYTTRRYSLKYFKHGDESQQNEYDQIIREIYWADSKGRTGQINGGWPREWGVSNADGAWVTYTGTLLGDDNIIKSESYGIPGSWTNCVDTPQTEFPVSGAIAADGSPVALNNVRFVKVHTGAFKYGSIFGEISTEIVGSDGTW